MAELPSLKKIRKQYLNKELIARKKEEYGNNLPKIAERMTQYLRERLKVKTPELMPEDVAGILGECLKVARIEDCWEMLQKCPCGTDKYMEKLFSYEESCRDYANYMWIADNYEEYLELEVSCESD